MGYTHYARVPELDDESRLEAYLEAARRTARDFETLYRRGALGVRLAGPIGRGEPSFSPLAFNGQAPEEDYESFWLPDREDLARHYREASPLLLFTKTGFDHASRRPYDLAVMVALALFKWHLGEGVRVSSDGNLHDWSPATELIARELGYPVDPYFVLERELYQVGDLLVEVDRAPETPPSRQVRELLENWLGSGLLSPAEAHSFRRALLETPQPYQGPPGPPLRGGASVYLSPPTTGKPSRP